MNIEEAKWTRISLSIQLSWMINGNADDDDDIFYWKCHHNFSDLVSSHPQKSFDLMNVDISSVVHHSKLLFGEY